MTQDAKFEDAGDKSVYIAAQDEEDLKVISSLLQDAVLLSSDMSWDTQQRRFALLVNRFRWEDREEAEKQNRKYERVRSLLAVDDVMKVASQGVDPKDKDTVLSILTLAFEPGPDGTGKIIFNLAGDGAIALEVEALNITLKDVTRPYIAPSGKAPDHN